MPELPEVETVRRDLERLTIGETVAAVQVLLGRTIAYPSPTHFSQGLVGCQLIGWRRRGKYLLGDLSGGACLGVHLRMSGQILWQDGQDPLGAHTRVILEMAGGGQLRFVDQRTFGQMWLVAAGSGPEQVIEALARLGPEPLGPGFSPRHLYDQLQGSRRPIKNALLDQRLVAGVGNIYADEALFLSRIHPRTPSQSLNWAECERLYQEVVRVLQDALQRRGTTFSAYRDVNGVNGNYQGQAWAYGRAGQGCRVCGTPIERIRLAGRSAHFCPRCQPS